MLPVGLNRFMKSKDQRTLWVCTSSKRAAFIALTMALASCGGGGEPGVAGQGDSSTKAATGPVRSQATFIPTKAIPADAYQRGMWSEVLDWPLIPLHAVVLPDGRLLTYGTDSNGTQTGNFIYDVWDPEQGLTAGHLTLPNNTGTDIFCSSQVLLPNGSGVFVAGGDNWTGTATTNTGNPNTNLFTVSNNTLTRGNNLLRSRWYSSSTTLLSGETYTQGGAGGTDFPEIRDTTGNQRLLSTAGTGAFSYDYPRNFVAPDGRIFGYDSGGRMYYVDTSGTGAVVNVGQLNSANTGGDASAAMFRPGRILQFGGNSNGAAVIDIRSGTPVVTATQSMATQRRLVNATILPDGKVLATGGSRTWNQLDQVAFAPEIWNPDTGTWTLGPNGVKSRLYHSTAVLMLDGSVLVAGGGAPGPEVNKNAELYFPPYLFTSGGTLAPRTVINSAPTVVDIGKTYTVATTGTRPVSRVVMVKTASVTHGWNMEQRFVELAFVNNAGALAIQAPTAAADATPGFYMLFVLDDAGVPSVAKIVRVNVASNPNPATVPTLANVADRNNTLGTAASVQLFGADPNGDTLRYAATGLPPGMSVNTSTGLISGTPNTVGSYTVGVSASDGVNTASRSFVWTVSGSSGVLQIAIATPTATAAGATANFTASTSNGVNTTYSWNFGDGTPSTAYSSSNTASHTYAKAGLYYVTLSALDDRGVVTVTTIQQTIYLPAVAGKAAQSGTLALEELAGGTARVWLVNQDANTVSVFNAATRAKLSEIAVGAAPRAVALAANGRVWVTNKDAATVSIINTANLTVERTLVLPRGSQPHGVVATAQGVALVVLEATGQVLRFDTNSYAQTGSLAVGANARHVSVAANGSTAYVSRFITAPLSGESTSAVSAAGGGEVMRIDVPTLALQSRITLAQSTLPDLENQGSGVPNYLGAAAISPDGSQAFVPSKQDNIRRGTLRNGAALNFQNTVRAISSRINLSTGLEDLAARVDHDNASVASAAAFDPRGVYLFVALETSRQVAVVDAHARRQIMRIEVGRAPQGLAVAADGGTLYVGNFLDRTLASYDLRSLRDTGLLNVPLLGSVSAVSVEPLAANVFVGKQLFYDARDTRLARDAYMSCASCHNDGGTDGRVWDMTGAGEGLRRTITLRGRGTGHGNAHWSGNFDEVQDFEGQIRTLAGGTGLMSDALYFAGTRSQPLGDKKAGLSADLDALAAYVASLTTHAPGPDRPSATTLTAAAQAGRTVFASQCAGCHAGAAFTNSASNLLADVGTLKASSGSRLGAGLFGLDTPTLRNAWQQTAWLHDGSAATLEAAISAHTVLPRALSATDLANVAAFVRQIGGDEGAVAVPGVDIVSRSKPVKQSSTAYSGVPERAVDGNTDGNYNANSVTHTNIEANPWWQVDLGSTYTVQTVRLWNRSDCCTTRLGNFVIFVSQSDMAGRSYTSLLADPAVARVQVSATVGRSLDVAVPAHGRYVRVQLAGTGILSLAEVEVFGHNNATTQGLAGQYFNSVNLNGAVALNRQEAVSFDWGAGAPAASVNADNFSVRWTGFVRAPATGSYTFQTASDDGVRLWVNGMLVIDNWTDHGYTTNNSANLNLVAGQKLSIRMEYYERGGAAAVSLRWSQPNQANVFTDIGLQYLSPN